MTGVAEDVEPRDPWDLAKLKQRDAVVPPHTAERCGAGDGDEDEERHDDSTKGEEGDGRQVPQPEGGERNQHRDDCQQLRRRQRQP